MGGIGKMGRIENCLLEWGEFFVINLWYKTTRREVPKMEKHLYFSKLTEKEQRMVSHLHHPDIVNHIFAFI